MTVAASDMEQVVACASLVGVDLEADPVNGGYYSSLPVDIPSAQSGGDDVSAIIRDCEESIFDDAAPARPGPDDSELLYDLYSAQADCLEDAGYAVGSRPTQAEFSASFVKDGLPPWQPFDSEEGALAEWARVNSDSEMTAYNVLLTRCPDPVRMWRYVMNLTVQ